MATSGRGSGPYFIRLSSSLGPRCSYCARMVRKPSGEGSQSLGLGVIDPPPATSNSMDQSRALQELQVLDDGCPRNGQHSLQLSSGAWRSCQPLKDHYPDRVTE